MSQAPFYRCVRCGNCCRWEGYVRVTSGEVESLAMYLGVSSSEFVEGYCRMTHDRSGLSLKERPDHACIFLVGGNRCAVQPVKPRQCVDFPNRWNFPGFREHCRAEPVLVVGG